MPKDARPAETRLIPAWTTLLGVALFGVAIWFLHHLLAQYRWHDVVLRVRAIAPGALARAALLTASGYACLTLYDLLGVRFVGSKLAYRRLALISFMAYGIGHNVGMNTLSGGAIRLRAYSALGLKPREIATIVAFGTGTFCLGAATLLGLSLLAWPRLSESVLHLNAAVLTLLGAALLAASAAYVVLAWLRREPVRIGKFALALPGPRIALLQVALACTDLTISAGVLYVLLPAQSGVAFAGFVGLYIIAVAAGVASTVPGGVGVFELVLSLLLPHVARDGLLGALLAYRAIYYLLPFAAALLLLAVYLGRQKGTLPADGARRVLDALCKVPHQMRLVLAQADDIKSIAKKHMRARDMLFLGRGTGFPIALEGALKLKEISYIHAEGYAAGEMKHGPIALIDEDMPVVVVCPKDAHYEKTLSNMQEVKAREGQLIAVCTTGDADVAKLLMPDNTRRSGGFSLNRPDSLPELDLVEVPHAEPEVLPLLTVIPLQMLAYFMADLKGTDVDQPRNLAKSLTVE